MTRLWMLLLAPSPIGTGCGGTTTQPPSQTSDATVETGGDFGSCGKATFDCLCACDAGSSCETTCYSMNPSCTACISDGVTRCCPTQYPAYTSCADAAAKPSDCDKEAAALQDCLATDACHKERAKCTGAT